MAIVTVDITNSSGDVVGYYTKDDTPRINYVLTRYQFRSRFTAAEKVAMYDSPDTMVRVFLDDVQAAESINVTDQDTVDGVSYLTSLGLIAAGRDAEILAGIPE
jgi:hypothetical protein